MTCYMSATSKGKNTKIHLQSIKKYRQSFYNIGRLMGIITLSSLLRLSPNLSCEIMQINKKWHNKLAPPLVTPVPERIVSRGHQSMSPLKWRYTRPFRLGHFHTCRFGSDRGWARLWAWLVGRLRVMNNLSISHSWYNAFSRKMKLRRILFLGRLQH